MKTQYSDNQPYEGDSEYSGRFQGIWTKLDFHRSATSEGGYGGDPFSRANQSPQQKGQFSFDRSDDRSAPAQQQDKSDQDDDMDKHAGEGIIPRKLLAPSSLSDKRVSS